MMLFSIFWSFILSDQAKFICFDTFESSYSILDSYCYIAPLLCNNQYFIFCLTKGYELPGGAPPGTPWLGCQERPGEDSSTCQDHRFWSGQASQCRWEGIPCRWRKGWLEIKIDYCLKCLKFRTFLSPVLMFLAFLIITFYSCFCVIFIN